MKEIEAHPEHVRAHVQVAAARYRLDSPAGLPFAREVVKLAPGYPFGHYLLGLLYFDTGDLDARDPRARNRSPDASRRSAVPVRARQRLRESGPRRRSRASARGLRSTQQEQRFRRFRTLPIPAVGTLRRLDLDSASPPASRPASRRPHGPHHVRRSKTESCLQARSSARRALPALRRSARSGCRSGCCS